MKKQYETPDVEVVKFQYSDQVVAVSSGDRCPTRYVNINNPCTVDKKPIEQLN